MSMRIISLKEVMDLTSLARSTIYKYIALGTFPLPLSVGGVAFAGWRAKCTSGSLSGSLSVMRNSRL